MVRTRRAFLAGATALTATIAGCSSDDSGGDGGSGGGGGMEQIDSFERNYSIEEDSWKGRDLEFTSQGRIEYEGIVRDGPAVDFYLMTTDEYDHFQNEERFQYVTDGTRQDTTNAEVSVTVPAGNYSFIVDNSNMGEATPPTDFDNSVANVEVSLSMYQ